MPLHIHDTLRREKRLFEPRNKDRVTLYVCGPTVYDYAHIGNARPPVVFDVLVRLLRRTYGADHVIYARNVTDVDDKINQKAAREGVPIGEITARYEAAYLADMGLLNVSPPDMAPHVTDHIPAIVAQIQSIVDAGCAYAAEGHVLFDVSSYKAYGALSGRNLDDMIAGARVEVAPYKKNPHDFVLWKPSKADEPSWPSPWGEGRPGWHIECSAMSGRYLGEVFDIHGGGLDLIFPHHENEIAQSRCAHGTHVMANVWMHNGFVQVEGRKMSKSEGNFVTIYELLHTEKFGGRKWPGEVLRLAMLMTHYREPIDFSVKRLEEAERLLAKWPAAEASDATPDETVLEALADDLNTVAAVQALHALAHAANVDPSKLPAFAASAALLGVLPKKAEMDEAIVSAVDALVQLRLEMLKAKNFAEADRLRDELSDKGIQLKDGKDKETGERTTTWELKR